MKHYKYSIGNVLKTQYGSIIIITKIGNGVVHTDEEYYNWISFESTNCYGGTYLNTRQRMVNCEDHCGHPCNDEDCICKGTGEYEKTDYGLDQATLLGHTVKDYIMKAITKNFNL